MEFTSPYEALTKFRGGDITMDECLSVIKAFPDKISIPRDCFENQTINHQIANESNEKFEAESFNFVEPISVTIKGAEFPMKTFVDTEMLGAANIVKSLFIEPLKLMSMWQFVPVVAYTALRRKDLEKMIYAFNRIAWRVISPYILKDQYCTKITPELRKITIKFLTELGISEFNAERFAKIVSHLIEYDNAYRLRLEDIFDNSNAELWRNPRKELKRLLKIFSRRDINPVVVKKVSQLVSVIRVALLVPKVKKAALKAIDECNFENLCLDESDRYWLTLRRDYHGMGLKPEELQEYGKAKGWKYPTQL